MQHSLGDLWSRANNVCFRIWPVRVGNSPDSLSLLMILILRTADGETAKFLAILCSETLFQKLLDYFCTRSLSKSGDPCAIVACEQLSFSGVFQENFFGTGAWRPNLENLPVRQRHLYICYTFGLLPEWLYWLMRSCSERAFPAYCNRNKNCLHLYSTHR